MISWPWGGGIILDDSGPNIVESLHPGICWNIMSLCQNGGVFGGCLGVYYSDFHHPHPQDLCYNLRGVKKKKKAVMAHSRTTCERQALFHLSNMWLVRVRKTRWESNQWHQSTSIRSRRQHGDLGSASPSPQQGSGRHGVASWERDTMDRNRRGEGRTWKRERPWQKKHRRPHKARQSIHPHGQKFGGFTADGRWSSEILLEGTELE